MRFAFRRSMWQESSKRDIPKERGREHRKMATSNSWQRARAILSSAEGTGGAARCQVRTVADLPGKRAFDIALSVTGLALGLPFMALGTAAVRLESSGPFFERTKCWGKGARVFARLRLRTTDSEGRMTQSGRILSRLGVNQMPQLVNVLRGEMSIVGPSLVLAGECDGATLRNLRRFDAAPGVTGLCKVPASLGPVPGSYVSPDEIYRSNRSVWLDLAIVARTLCAVLAGRG